MVLDNTTVVVGAIPAFCMFACTILGLGIKVPDDIAGALQHFAAGILLSAVGSELLPTLLRASGWKENFCATLGFFAGMGVLIFLGAILSEEHVRVDVEGNGNEGDGEHDDNDNDDDNDGSGNRQQQELADNVFSRNEDNDAGTKTNITIGEIKQNPGVPAFSGYPRSATIVNVTNTLDKIVRHRRLKSATGASLKASAKAINDEYWQTYDTLWEDKTETSKVDTSTNDQQQNQRHEGKALLSVASTSTRSSSIKAFGVVEKALPVSFLVAIVIDSFMDGFLIGISGVAGWGTTIIMAGSLCVEMSFVGLTLATACHGMPYSKSVPAALAGPITLVVGAIIGDLVTIVVEGNPSLVVGIMGFGASALLFMGAEELLLEAHEDGEHVWWVDVQLYTGFYCGFMATKFLPET